MRTTKMLLASCLFVLAASFNPALCAPQTGWWWNPAESGRGFYVETNGETTFLGAYFYEEDGHAIWLVAAGSNTNPYTFTEQLFYMASGQTLYGSYVQPAGPTCIGAITARFSDDTHATITWPGGTVTIERHIFGGPDAPVFQPVTGWWWNSDESGNGYSIAGKP
jgi:hypothetical protein